MMSTINVAVGLEHRFSCSIRATESRQFWGYLCLQKLGYWSLRLLLICTHEKIHIPTKQKRRSTGQGTTSPFDHQRPEKNGSRMAPAAMSFRAPSECHGLWHTG